MDYSWFISFMFIKLKRKEISKTVTVNIYLAFLMYKNFLRTLLIIFLELYIQIES